MRPAGFDVDAYNHILTQSAPPCKLSNARRMFKKGFILLISYGKMRGSLRARIGIRASVGENGRVKAGTEVPAHQTVYPNETFDGTARRAAATAPVRPATARSDKTEQERTRSASLTRS